MKGEVRLTRLTLFGSSLYGRGIQLKEVGDVRPVTGLRCIASNGVLACFRTHSASYCLTCSLKRDALVREVIFSPHGSSGCV